jgi:hypothetical protein
MAFSFVQTKQSSATGTSVVVTPTAPIGSKNLVVINLKFGAAPTGLVITDNAPTPNSYAVAVPLHTASSMTVIQLYGVALSPGATTITASWIGSTGARITIDEFSGGLPNNALVFDKGAFSDGSGLSVTTPLTPSLSGELIVSMVGMNNATAVAIGSGYSTGTNNVSSSTEYKLSGTTTETAPFTLTGTSVTWNSVIGSYVSVRPPSVAMRLDQMADPLIDVLVGGQKLKRVGGIENVGSMASGYRITSVDTAMTVDDSSIEVTVTGKTVTLLPASASLLGMQCNIINTSAGAINVSCTSVIGNTGSSTTDSIPSGNTFSYVSNGAVWRKI